MSSGDRCPVCGRRLTVYCTRHIGDSVVRFIGCRRRRGSGCGWRPAANKIILGSTQHPRLAERS